MNKTGTRLLTAAVAAILAACNSGNTSSSTSTGGASSPAASAPAPAATSDGIVHAGDGVIFGSGWYPIEHYKGATFRWSTNDGEITVCPDANNRTLAVLLEPGPGIGSRTATLTVLGNHGDHASATIKGRQYVKVSVANGVPAETFVILAHSQDLPSPNGDKRILNYRALNAVVGSSMADCKNDLVRDGSPLALGTGWYKYETFNGQSFRWVGNDAQLKLTATQAHPFTIEADVEPGPSLGGAPLVITLHDAAGKTVAQSKAVVARSYVSFAIPPESKGSTLTLQVASKNKPVAHDPRTLNFRVFDLKVKPS